MQPTYTFSQVKAMVGNLDNKELNILRDLVQEEKKRYSLSELKAIYKAMILRVQYLQRQAGQNGTGGISSTWLVSPDDFD
jgi:hypothetical protein